MSTQLELLKNRLFGDGGLNVGNIKLFPGSSRDVTPEQIAEQINRGLSQLESGTTEEDVEQH